MSAEMARPIMGRGGVRTCARWVREARLTRAPKHSDWDSDCARTTKTHSPPLSLCAALLALLLAALGIGAPSPAEPRLPGAAGSEA